MKTLNSKQVRETAAGKRISAWIILKDGKYTSEYMPSMKYILRKHYPETQTHIAHTSDKSFRTKSEAEFTQKSLS